MSKFAEGDKVEITNFGLGSYNGYTGVVKIADDRGLYEVVLDSLDESFWLTDDEIALRSENPFAAHMEEAVEVDSENPVPGFLDFLKRLGAVPVEEEEAEEESSFDPRDEWNFGALNAAGRHARVATFVYAKGDGDVLETRHFIPEHVHESTNSETVIFVGLDLDREDIRAFRLDRIQGYVAV